MVFLILIIFVFTTIVVSNKFAKNKTSIEIMLMGIEITIIGVAFMSFGEGMTSNDNIIFCLIGVLIVSIGFTASIFGFIKN